MMNMHAPATQLTPAEAALVDGFVARMSDLPGNGAVMARRDDAVERIKAGLPTRRVEAWHYTDLRRLLTIVPDFDPAAKVTQVAPLVAGSAVFALLNGAAAPVTAPDGLTVTALAEQLKDGVLADRLAPVDADDAVGAVNAALVSDGFSVQVAEGVELAHPVELQNLHGGGQVHGRFDVTVGAGAKATFIERQAGEGSVLASSLTSVEIGDGAEIVWIVLQEQPDDSSHLGQFNARLGENAKLVLFVVNAGGRLVRQEVRVAAAGDESVFTLRGVNLLAGQTHCDVSMVLEHLGYGAASTEIVRNVVTGKAHGVFQGQIRVAREAQKTDAKMACNTLLLSDEGEFSTKPELEIFADDVACGHGATVSEINTDHLFYLMARGVPEHEARALLVKAFLAEIIEELQDEVLVEALEAKLDAWFTAHG